MWPPPRWTSFLFLLLVFHLLLAPSPSKDGIHERASPKAAHASEKEVSAPCGLQLGARTAGNSRYWTFTVDRKYVRWLWWPMLVYFFWGMAYICDEYFVRTIEVISERFHIPDDVAGATLMALGCNGPEMALNTIGIFRPSNIGVGAVIGGEVFNVLVIIGTALLATPDLYLPLKVGKFSFFRDVIFYCVSVLMLFIFLRNGEITRQEAVTLLSGAVVYSTVVVLSNQLRHLVYGWREAWRARLKYGSKVSEMVRRAHSITELLNPPPRSTTASEADGYSPMDDDGDEVDEVDLISLWTGARHCANPEEGTVIKLRVELRSRMMDRYHHATERYVWLSEDALNVSAAGDLLDAFARRTGRDSDKKGLIYEHGEHHQWHMGGLVNAATLYSENKGQSPGRAGRPRTGSVIPPATTYKTPMLSVSLAVPEAAEKLGLADSPWEQIPLEDILYCDRVEGNDKMFTLHVHQHTEELKDLGRLITLEFLVESRAVHDAWVEALLKGLKARRRQEVADGPPVKSYFAAAVELVEWFQFPIMFLARATIPDMDTPHLQRWYPVAFTMSMAWLAVFAYCVVAACDLVHADFGLSNSLLGYTIAAAGTSFPNVFSGIVVSRQGKTTMALANALGANIQNVFLALAVPWTIHTCFVNHGPIALPVKGLVAAVVEIYATLVPVLLVYFCCSGTFPRWAGGLFLATYAVYLIIALGQESSGCETWPIPCS